MEIVQATTDDISELAILVEKCFRGEESKMGWTSEADYVTGTKGDPVLLRKEMERPGALILKCVDNSVNGGKIVGCVYVERQGKIAYTGLLCVQPDLQMAGIGKKLVAAADDKAREWNCTALKLSLYLQRKEMLEWYERRGFRRTDEVVEKREGTGKPKVKVDLVMMQKDL